MGGLLVHDGQFRGPWQSRQLYRDRSVVCKIEGRMRHLLMVGVITDRMGMVCRVVIAVVVRLLALLRIRGIVNSLRKNRISIVMRMGRRRRGQEDQRCNQHTCNS
jgi:hypothetical protein